MITPIRITELLFVGPGPTSVEEVEALSDFGVTGLLSLQTDEDLGGRGLRWSTLWQLLVSRGIEASRVPIRDFDKRDLGQRIDAALEALDPLLVRGRPVYLHCTAGINRSPSVAIAHLARSRGLARAHADVLAAHADAVPYLDVLEKWAKRNRLPR
jgi:hypothetical protein